MLPQPWITARRPLSIWHRDLGIGLKDFLLAAVSGAGNVYGATHGVPGCAEKAGLDFAKAIAAIHLKGDPQGLAWSLIWKSLVSAASQLITEHKDLIPTDWSPVALDATLQALEFRDDTEIALPPTLFDDPSKLDIVNPSVNAFKQVLRTLGFSEAQASNISGRLPSYFVFCLAAEWRTNPTLYSSLKEALATPFDLAAERELAWYHYNAFLRKLVDESVLGDTFGLSQVYVPLRGGFIADGEADNQQLDASAATRARSLTVVDLGQHLRGWLESSDREQAVKILCGGPGCGKSTFAKIFAAAISVEFRIRVLYIPLHLFNVQADLSEALKKFILDRRILPTDTLDFSDRLLLIFDGLDELAEQGKVAKEVAQKFVSALNESLRSANYLSADRLRWHALLTGRDVAIQEIQNVFRKPGQILHVLPYYITEEEAIRNFRVTSVTQKALLERDDRPVWWKKYGIVSGKGYSTLPAELDKADLTDITAQPLLNYLLALSLGRGKVRFGVHVNLNNVYADLIDAVYERGYEGNRPHLSTSIVSKAQFFHLLEEIALATWHGNGRTTTIQEIQDHCTLGGLGALLIAFTEGIEAGVTRLLTAFYFRIADTESASDKTFEFTHKSFGEYLTARRVLRQVRTTCVENQRKLGSYITGWDHQECLRNWAEVMGPTQIDRYLFKFLRNEFALVKVKEAAEWQSLFVSLIDFFLRSDFPMDQVQRLLSFKDKKRCSSNASSALIIMVGLCSSRTMKMSHVSWPNDYSASKWLREVLQLGFRDDDMVCQSLHHLDLRGQHLGGLNLFGSDLRGSNLDNTMLTASVLAHADAREASFVGSKMYSTILEGAKLERADLSRSYIVMAQVSGAKFDYAKMDDSVVQLLALDGPAGEPSFRGVAWNRIDFDDGRDMQGIARLKKTAEGGVDTPGSETRLFFEIRYPLPPEPEAGPPNTEGI